MKLKENYIIQDELRCCFNCKYFEEFYEMGFFCIWTKNKKFPKEPYVLKRAVEVTGHCINFEKMGE